MPRDGHFHRPLTAVGLDGRLPVALPRIVGADGDAPVAPSLAHTLGINGELVIGGAVRARANEQLHILARRSGGWALDRLGCRARFDGVASRQRNAT